MADPKFWGDLIITLRVEQQMSQRELSQRTGVNRSTLRRIEREGGGDIAIIEKVLELLGYELEAESLESKERVLKRRIEEVENPSQRSAIATRAIINLRF